MNKISTRNVDDKNATFDARAADEIRVAWDVAEGIADDRIMVLDPASMTASSFSPKTFVGFLNLDGRNMTWSTVFGNGGIYLATESGGAGLPATTAPAPAPCFGLIMTATGFLVGVFLARRRK
jgi:hypothetical protein